MGVQVGDLILSVNGAPIGMMGDLRNEVQLAGVGGEVVVELLRDGKPQTLTGTVQPWPEHIPFEPLDTAAEERFRAWQGERWDRIDQATQALSDRLDALERQPWVADGGRPSLGAKQVAALQRLPAFRLRLQAVHDSADRRTRTVERHVSWDARVLIGTPSLPPRF
jgi:hypothetical protein